MIPACAHEANQGRSTRGAFGDRLGDRMLEGDPVDPSSRLVQFTTGHSAPGAEPAPMRSVSPSL